MNTKILAAAFLVASLSVPAFAEVDVRVSADIRIGKVPPPPPPDVVIITDAGPPGPPPWAPAHGYRRNRTYYYYPGCDVYYRPVDHLWFYVEGTSWRTGPRLPPDIRVDFSRSVPLTMETDRPYDFHEKIRTYYPANYFVAHVRLKDEHSKDDYRKPDHANNDGDHDGSGNSNSGQKGKGKGKPKDK